MNINEIGGNSGSVRVRLYEAGNRSLPIAEKVYAIAAYHEIQLDPVFAALGLDSEERRKDRTNVLAVITAETGNLMISAVGVAVDAQTGDTRFIVFSPTGGVPATGVPSVDNAEPVAQIPAPVRRRAAEQ